MAFFLNIWRDNELLCLHQNLKKWSALVVGFEPELSIGQDPIYKFLKWAFSFTPFTNFSNCFSKYWKYRNKYCLRATLRATVSKAPKYLYFFKFSSVTRISLTYTPSVISSRLGIYSMRRRDTDGFTWHPICERRKNSRRSRAFYLRLIQLPIISLNKVDCMIELV